MTSEQLRRHSQRSAVTVAVGIVAIAAVACITKDPTLTGLTGGYIVTSLGILTHRHTAEDMALRRFQAEPTPPPAPATKETP